MPPELHFVSEPKLQSSVLLPLVIHSNADLLLPVLESALNQRKELGIKIPVAVVSVVSDCDTRVQVCVRASDSKVRTGFVGFCLLQLIYTNTPVGIIYCIYCEFESIP